MLLVLPITFHYHYIIWGCLCSTSPFQFWRLKWYIYSSCYYHHQIGSINLTHCCHIFRGCCYVAICDRRILWRCRNLWLKVSQFVTGVAICDGKCRNLWQRQNMQFSDIYSLNFDKYFVLSSYLYLCETYFSRLSLNFVSSNIVFIHELFGHSNSLVMAQNSKSHNDVRRLQQ